MIEVAAPADVNGDMLAEELRAAGLDVARVSLVGDVLRLDGLGRADAATAQQVVNAHRLPAPSPDLVEAARAKVAKLPAGPQREAFAAVIDALTARS